MLLVYTILLKFAHVVFSKVYFKKTVMSDIPCVGSFLTISDLNLRLPYLLSLMNFITIRKTTAEYSFHRFSVPFKEGTSNPKFDLGSRKTPPREI